MHMVLYLKIAQIRIRIRQMPSIYQFLENPEIFPYESTLSDNPDILNALIDYISRNPDPLLHNEQECYVYPSRAADILALGTTYRTIIAKRERKSKKTNEQENYYPYLDRLFKNLHTSAANIEESLLGYTNKVLISLAKKTPQIYEYMKDNQEIIGVMIKNNQFLRHFKQFWINFLIESTMGLYVFLKNVVIRTLMFRIIDEKETDNLAVYETLFAVYSEISRKMKLKLMPEDEKEELEEICANFHDQDFMTLLVLKISSKNSQKTYFIGKLLNEMLNFPQTKVFSSFSMSHMEAVEQYFQSYEDSSGFMDQIKADQLQILKLLLVVSQKLMLQPQYQVNFLKRLLVYSSIHKRNSILHSILIKLLHIILDTDRTEVFKQINVIGFLMKNPDTKGCRYAYGSLIWKVCAFWAENQDKLGQYLAESEKVWAKERVQENNSKFVGLNFYKLTVVNKSELISEQSQEISPEKKSQPSPVKTQKPVQPQTSPQAPKQ